MYQNTDFELIVKVHARVKLKIYKFIHLNTCIQIIYIFVIIIFYIILYMLHFYFVVLNYIRF